MKKASVFVWLTSLFVVGLVVWAVAGSLNPAAGPGSTMKTLDQVESRIAIPGYLYGATTYTISQPGSYYLTGDRLVGPGSYGLHITASDVTVDLNGYALKMIMTPGYSGIYIDGADNVEIRNGTIRDFAETGITGLGDNIRISNLRILNNGINGISLSGTNNQIRGCTISGNAGSGIYVFDNAIVIGNTCSNNSSQGIFARFGSVVSNNACCQNGTYGISTRNSLVSGNACYGNTTGAYFPDSNSTFVNNEE